MADADQDSNDPLNGDQTELSILDALGMNKISPSDGLISAWSVSAGIKCN